MRTRDELQARLDLANLARADVLVSIHINSITQNGVVFEIAATQTFYTDETPWGVDGHRAAGAATSRTAWCAAMDPVASYERQDRGIDAHQPVHRGAAAVQDHARATRPAQAATARGADAAVLTEVGSITLRQEQNLLASPPGQAGGGGWHLHGPGTLLQQSTAGGRLHPARAAAGAGDGSAPLAGDGPMYWPPTAAGDELLVRLTNTGSQAWPAGLHLDGAWQATEQPYLRVPPKELHPWSPIRCPPSRPASPSTSASPCRLRRIAGAKWPGSRWLAPAGR